MSLEDSVENSQPVSNVGARHRSKESPSRWIPSLCDGNKYIYLNLELRMNQMSVKTSNCNTAKAVNFHLISQRKRFTQNYSAGQTHLSVKSSSIPFSSRRQISYFLLSRQMHPVLSDPLVVTSLEKWTLMLPSSHSPLTYVRFNF